MSCDFLVSAHAPSFLTRPSQLHSPDENGTLGAHAQRGARVCACTCVCTCRFLSARAVALPTRRNWRTTKNCHALHGAIKERRFN